MDDDDKSHDIDPRKRFYLKVPIIKSNDKIEPDWWEDLLGSETLQPVLDAEIDHVTEHGGTSYIYECIPIRKISDGRVRVRILPKPK